MAIEIYPTSVYPSIYGYSNSPRHKTLINTSDSGVELRRRLIRFSKRNFNLKYRYITTANRNTLMNFFTERRGPELPFWFLDSSTDYATKEWKDEYVGRGGPLPLLSAVAADATVFTDETIACKNATANGMTLLPAVPAENDAYYFGSLTKFDKLTVVIGTPGDGVWTIIWEYFNGSTWGVPGAIADGTTHFRAAAGARDVTFNVPTDWAITTPPATTYPVNELNAFYLRARVSAYTSVVTQPKGSGATTNSKTYELHSVGGANGTTYVYVDGVLQTAGGADYIHVSGGGICGGDLIVFTAYPAVGTLITSHFTGRLRIKGRFASDELTEQMDAPNCWNIETSIQEIQW